MIFPDEIQAEINAKLSKENVVVIHSALSTSEINRGSIAGCRVGMDYTGKIGVKCCPTGRVDIIGKYIFKGGFFNAEVWVSVVVQKTAITGSLEQEDIAFCIKLMEQIGALDVASDLVYKILSLYGFNVVMDSGIPQTTIEA
jgi:hypothetical protein